MSTPQNRRAEELFVEYLARRDAGESVELDALCAAHPELSAAIRELDRAVEVVRRLGIRSGGSGPLSASPAQRYGPDVDPGRTGFGFGLLLEPAPARTAGRRRARSACCSRCARR